MRFEDKPDQRGPRRDRPRQQQQPRPKPRQESFSGGAMADALRRAGLTRD
jgi:hypothetical protein